MQSSLFNEKMLQWVDQDLSWKEVVNKGVQILVDNGYATSELADAIFESTRKYGAYYVLIPGLALLHAAPGDYALKTGTSTLILANEVEFNNDPEKKARIIITLSAPNNKDHMGLLQEFSHWFGNPDLAKKIINVKSLDEFKKVVNLN